MGHGDREGTSDNGQDTLQGGTGDRGVTKDSQHWEVSGTKRHGRGGDMGWVVTRDRVGVTGVT